MTTNKQKFYKIFSKHIKIVGNKKKSTSLGSTNPKPAEKSICFKELFLICKNLKIFPDLLSNKEILNIASDQVNKTAMSSPNNSTGIPKQDGSHGLPNKNNDFEITFS